MIDVRIRHSVDAFSLHAEFASFGPALGVFGPSGSGKTTLLHTIAGLVSPALADVTVGDRALSPAVAPEHRRVGLVTQDALLFPHRSVRENLTYAPGARERLGSADGRRVLDVLRLGELLDRRPDGLSGGEQQRVAIGRALLGDPALLLLDEPTSALDAGLSRDVLGLLSHVKRELRVPMVFVTHRAAELLSIVDDCVVLDAGRVVAQGPPVEVLSRPTVLGVASLVGVENLLRLTIVAHDLDGGVTRLRVAGDIELAAPLMDHPIGSDVDVGFSADDVLVCLEPPRGVSARNALPAAVRSLASVGHDVLTTMAVGDTIIRARLTPAAVADLSLAPGARVVAVLKSSSVHRLSGG